MQVFAEVHGQPETPLTKFAKDRASQNVPTQDTMTLRSRKRLLDPNIAREGARKAWAEKHERIYPPPSDFKHKVPKIQTQDIPMQQFGSVSDISNVPNRASVSHNPPITGVTHQYINSPKSGVLKMVPRVPTRTPTIAKASTSSLAAAGPGIDIAAAHFGQGLAEYIFGTGNSGPKAVPKNWKILRDAGIPEEEWSIYKHIDNAKDLEKLLNKKMVDKIVHDEINTHIVKNKLALIEKDIDLIKAIKEHNVETSYDNLKDIHQTIVDELDELGSMYKDNSMATALIGRFNTKHSTFIKSINTDGKYLYILVSINCSTK